jgi:predicted aspartyl protease
MTEYSRDFDPPAPFIDMIVAAPSDSGSQRSVGALLDTGAEVSVIPQQIVHELELSPYAEMVIEAFDGRRQRVNLYVVALEIAGTRLSLVRAIAYSTSYAILGRDVLNRFLTTLDGPHLSFEITASNS